jgi:transcription elongation factor GreA
MASDVVPMTVAGHAALKEKLKFLKGVERPRVILMLSEARSHGDLSENAEYDAAREKQGFLEGQIAEIEGRLSRAQVIDPTTLSGNKIIFGATVTLIDGDTEQKVVWTIVGDDETDLEKRKIGISSPLARAMIGKVVGDDIEMKTPKGEKSYEVKGIAFQGAV